MKAAVLAVPLALLPLVPAKLAPSERVDIHYAMIFPGMTIIKMLFVNVVHAVS